MPTFTYIHVLAEVITLWPPFNKDNGKPEQLILIAIHGYALVSLSSRPIAPIAAVVDCYRGLANAGC